MGDAGRGGLRPGDQHLSNQDGIMVKSGSNQGRVDIAGTMRQWLPRLGLVGALLAGAIWLAWASDPPLRIAVNEDGSVRLEWDAQPGEAYRLYWNSNLVQEVEAWHLVTNVTASGSTMSFRDVGGSGRSHPREVAERFYALRVEQTTNTTTTVINTDFFDPMELTAAGSPYVITNDVRIRAGVRLTLGAGVRVLFGPQGRLTVEGELQAEGAPGRPVVFTSSRLFAQRGDWPGLRWVGAESGGSLSNAVVEFAVNGVSVADGSPSFTAVTIHRSRDIGLLLDRSSSMVRNCLIERNGLDGVRAQNRSAPQLLGNKIRVNGRHGVALVGVTASDQNPLAVVRGNSIVANTQQALETLNFFQPTLQRLDCRSNWWGTAVAVEVPAVIADQTDRATSPWVDWGNWLESEDGPATPGRSAFGQVQGTEFWRTSESPVWVLGPLTVSSNAALNVERGVTVQVVGNWRIDVSGSMSVGGTTNEPVRFTTARPFPGRGQWLGVRFNDASVDAGCVWSNAVVEFAVRGIECIDASPALLGITARESSQHGIFLERSSPRIEGGAMESNTQDGIHCTWSSSPLISGARIRLNGSDGIELVGSTTAERNPMPVIRGNIFAGNTTFDLHANNYIRPGETVIQARGNWWGTAVWSQIPARIFDIHDRNTSPYVDWGGPMQSEGGPVAPGISAVGSLTGDTVWRRADSPVTVVGNLLVGTNGSLRIEPGVEVRFVAGYRLDVSGVLRVLGSASDPVFLTSAEMFPRPGDWEGIRFLDDSDDARCEVSNAVVEFARTGIVCVDASPTVSGSMVMDNSVHGMLLVRSAARVHQTSLQYNVQDGIHCLSNSTPLITFCAMQGNGSDGIEVAGVAAVDRNSFPVIHGSALDGNVQFALRTGPFFQPATSVIQARSNWWGTANPAAIPASIIDQLDGATAPWVDWGNWLESDTGPATPGTTLFGGIREDRTLATGESPVWMLGPVTIATNAVLRVERDVSVVPVGNWRIEVLGGLAADGTSEQPVIFRSGQPIPGAGQWLGIRFADSSVDAACVLSNVVIQNAARGIECIDASPTFIGLTSRSNSQHGLYLERSSPLIRGGEFSGNGQDGIHCVWLSAPVIQANLIRGNASDGIELAGITASNRNSAPVILLNRIEGNNGFALNANTFFNARQTVIAARSNWWGTVDGTLVPARIFDQNDNANAPWVDWGNWLISEEGPSVPGRAVFGTIADATTWLPGEGTVSVIGPLSVATNGVLRIEAGVQVEFFVTNGLTVDGGLMAMGSVENPVIFTSGRPTPVNGSWGGIRFNPTSTNLPCVISNSVVEYAMSGVYGQRTDLTVHGSQLRRNTIGIFLDTASALVVSNLVEFNGTGIHVSDLSLAQLTGNTVTLQTSHGVNATPTRTTINVNPVTVLTGNSFSTNGTVGTTGRNVFVGNYATPAAVTINAVSNWWAGATDTNVISAGLFHRRNATGSPTIDFANPLVDNPNFKSVGTRPSEIWFSPNADGNRDQLVVESMLSHEGTWEVTIVDGSRTPVATRTGSGRVVTMTWDGNGPGGVPVAEGRYRPVVRATQSGTGARSVTFGDHFQLDRVAPTSSPSIPVIADGAVIDTLDVLGSAWDRYFSHYLVEYGRGLSPTNYILARSNSVPATGLFWSLNSRDLENGQYTFRIRSFDLAGNVTETRIPVVIDNLSILNPQAASVFFDPGTGPAQVSFDLTRQGDVVFDVCRVEASIALMGDAMAVTQTNRVVRRVTSRLGSGRHTFTWDGTDLAGNPVTNGIYGFIIRAHAELGRKDLYDPQYVAGPVTVSNFSYKTNFAFYANEKCEVTYNLFTPAFVVLAVQNRPYVVLWGDIRPAGTHVEYWDGRSNEDRSLLYGAFRLGIKPQVLPENGLVVNRPMPPLVADLQAESYIFTPTLSEVSEIHYTLSRPARVRLQVREPNGGLITLVDGVDRAGGFHRTEWDGALAGRMLVQAEGDYEVILRATDVAGNQVETRTANVRVRR